MSEETNRELILNRVLNAPLDRVWQAWTDPAEVQKWWGPAGVTNPTCIWEAQPGGTISIVMLAGPELGEMSGQEWPMDGRFQEVIPKSKLLFSARALVEGQPVLETLTTVTFEAAADQTKLTVHIAVTKTTPQAAGPLAGMEMGWNQQLDKLNGQLA